MINVSSGGTEHNYVVLDCFILDVVESRQILSNCNDPTRKKQWSKGGTEEEVTLVLPDHLYQLVQKHFVNAGGLVRYENTRKIDTLMSDNKYDLTSMSPVGTTNLLIHS